MEIVGLEGADGVHTIDVWFSKRRQRWILERFDAAGDVIGSPFCTPDEIDASTCLAEWLRSHDETHLVGRAPSMIAEAKRRMRQRPQPRPLSVMQSMTRTDR